MENMSLILREKPDFLSNLIDKILRTKDDSWCSSLSTPVSRFPQACTLFLSQAIKVLSRPAPRGQMGSGYSSGVYPLILSPGTHFCFTVPGINELTVTFTWTHVLKFFLQKLTTWRSSYMGKVLDLAREGPAPSMEAFQEQEHTSGYMPCGEVWLYWIGQEFFYLSFWRKKVFSYVLYYIVNLKIILITQDPWML